MGEKLIKPYEISVWEEQLTQIEGSNPAEYRFKEKKLAVIGSDTMTGPNKIYDPVFNKKTNGEKTLTFSLKYKYFDPYSENENVVNPFAALLVNERKVKLHYEDEWYEFIIKDHTESSEEYTWTYTCTDAFVLELSKSGYNIEFSTDLDNNHGTAPELAAKTLENTDWQVREDSDLLQQLVAEPIYKATLVTTSNIDVINTKNGSAAFEGQTNVDIYLFFNYVKNKNGKFVQFITKRDTADYIIDDKNVITDTNYRIMNELVLETREANDKIIKEFWYIDENKNRQLVISVDEIETRFQANRLVYAQKNTYDPVMERTVDIFQVGENGREVYRYTDYTYTTSNVVMNYIANGDNFNSLEDGSLQGWNPYVDSTDNEAIQKLELVTYPELKKGEPLADLEILSQIQGYLKVNFVGAVTNDYRNMIFNDGIQSNTAFINSISRGDEFVFRWRAGSGDVDNLQPVQTLGLVVARYTRDTPQRWGRYYYHPDLSDKILEIKGTPTELNNIIEGGEIRSTEDGEIYVINEVAQSISTKYLYKSNGELYYWDGINSCFKEKDNDYLPYYYLIGKAEKAISNAILTDPTVKYGIFIYTTAVDTETYIDEETEESYTKIQPIYIQDIQLTRCVRDANDQIVTIGNVPTATVNPVEYYYLKPSDGTAAEDIQTYTSVEELQVGIETTDDIVPIYNENSEKYLSISISQSNRFNILQTIAETFECWVDIVVNHDDNGAIERDENGRLEKYICLREYVGKDNWAGFRYGINLNSIERNVNSDEIVTKLIVDNSQSEYVDEGFVSIANAPSNPSGEQYILNFDYYYNQGLLNREEVEKDKQSLLEQTSKLNIELQELEQKRRELEASLTDLGGKRNVYTELIDSAEDEQVQALDDFEYLTEETYDNYRQIQLTAVKYIDNFYILTSDVEIVLDKDYYSYNSETGVMTLVESPDIAALNTYYELLDDLTEEETILDTLGRLYLNSAIINNYSGILSNISTEYWKVRKELYGSENYTIKVWTVVDELGETHAYVEISDYLIGLQFYFGNNTQETYESTISKKYFNITTNETTITFIAPSDYTMETTTITLSSNPTTLKIVATEEFDGVEDQIDKLIEQKKKIVDDFNNKYSRFIVEGTWNSTDYIDSELYYLDALQVSNTSAQPAISYTINVVEVSKLEGLENYSFDVGDKTYVEDTEFFGWASKDGILTPAREEVIVSEVEWHLDEPENNVITVQNYKTRFEDLFQRVNAAVQTVQYNEATYAKISSLMDANGTINANVLVQSLKQIAGKEYALTSDGSIQIDEDRILVTNLTNTQNLVIINSEGIRISSDGGSTWATAIDGRGINIGTVYTGMLNTDQVVIGSNSNPSFRWDKSGISAYKSGEDEVYDLKTFVRYDQYGLYGIKNNGAFKAQSLQDVKNNAHFAVTWDGFFIKNSYEGGGRVEITSDNDFRVLNDPQNQGNFQEKIKIGALEWGEGITSPDAEGATALPTLYGIRIKNDAGAEVMKTDDDGNITISGTINANAGNIGGMVVNNDWLRMNYIVLEPGEGIYSTYPNVKGEPPVDPLISAYPFWISDTDGSAIFNNVIVRGSIKTSVFEYEEIQAVGGAFMFRPSSAVREVVRNGNDLIFTTEKPGLFKVGSWLKISNFSSADEQDEITPDELNGFGLTYIYPVASINGRQVRLTGAAEILDNNVTNLEELCGGSLIDMGNQAGTSNYGIGINSSDGFINLPPRAISLFETVIHPNQDPKVSYKYRGILGTLPDERVNNLNVNTNIYQNMRNTQGIYTDNMYIGDLNQYIAFYEDANGNKQLKIKANQIVYEVVDDDTGQTDWHDVSDIEAEGVPGPQGPAGQDAITVKIDSSAGEVFLNKQITTTLTCTVIKGNGTDITNQVTRFNWIKKKADGTVDTSWSRPLAGNTISISEADVTSKAIFICEVEF